MQVQSVPVMPSHSAGETVTTDSTNQSTYKMHLLGDEPGPLSFLMVHDNTNI
jgi:hypothetical protein